MSPAQHRSSRPRLTLPSASPWPSPWLFARAHWLDVALIVLAVVFAAPSLIYPFGADQAVHFYVGRNWLHGGLPYRDAFDYKPPGIFALHALLIALFGEEQWPARAADILGIVALGAACARLLSRRPRGATGLTCLAASVLYFGYFSFWDTVQCELWCALFGTVAIVLARNGRAGAAGAAAGAALCMKTPAVFLIAIAAVYVVHTQPARRIGALVRFALGGALLPLLTLGYFAARGGLGAMAEALGGATWAYVAGSVRVESTGALLRETLLLISWFNPFSSLVVAAMLGARWSRGRNDEASSMRSTLALSLLLAGYLGIAVQLKFYRYHYALILPGLLVALGESALWAIPRLGRVRMHAAAAAACVLVAFGISGEPERWWWLNCQTLLDSAAGAPRRQMLAHYAMPGLYYDPVDLKDAGDWLRARTLPTDPILVRGFLPEVYVVARRWAPTRFFWTIPFMDKNRSYRTDAWIAEDRADTLRAPPAYVVTLASVHQGPDSAEYYTPLGYAPVTRFGNMLILQRHAL